MQVISATVLFYVRLTWKADVSLLRLKCHPTMADLSLTVWSRMATYWCTLLSEKLPWPLWGKSVFLIHRDAEFYMKFFVVVLQRAEELACPLSQPLFNNDSIKVGNKNIWHKRWIPSGVCCLSHVLHKNYAFLSFEVSWSIGKMILIAKKQQTPMKLLVAYATIISELGSSIGESRDRECEW